MADPAPRRSWLVLCWQLALASYGIALVTGTHLPPTFPGLPNDYSDKVIHFGAYAGLAWLAAMTWEFSTGRLNRRHLWLLWLVIIAFGAIDELTQAPIGRDASWLDWLADATGAATGLAIFRICQIWLHHKQLT